MDAILIIDDDSRNIFALSAILKAKGFTILSAGGMQEAFALLHHNTAISYILLDMMMPEMDGYEALEKLKQDKRYRHIPVISVTAQAMVGDREKCLAAGADGYVSKPVDIDKLLALIKG
jgi:CheY-like chemotaxis protein